MGAVPSGICSCPAAVDTPLSDELRALQNAGTRASPGSWLKLPLMAGKPENQSGYAGIIVGLFQSVLRQLVFADELLVDLADAGFRDVRN